MAIRILYPGVGESDAIQPGSKTSVEWDFSDLLAGGVAAIPEVPGVAEIPEVPAVPEMLEVPAVPGTPEVPAVMDDQGVITTPAVPAVPGTPEVPGIPAIPAVPGTPGIPAIPAVPAVPNEVVQSATVVVVDRVNAAVADVAGAALIVEGAALASVVRVPLNNLIDGEQYKITITATISNDPMLDDKIAVVTIFVPIVAP